MSQKMLSNLFKTSAILWAIWGLFHMFIGIVLIMYFTEEHPSGSLHSIPEILNTVMFGNESPFPPIATLKQHAFNLAWMGLVVTIGSVFVWKKNKIAIFTCILIGGLADLGYFLYVDLPGYATSPGPEMTYIMATAIILAFFAYFKSDKLNIFNQHATSQKI